MTTDSKQYKDLMQPGSFTGATLTASGIKNALIIFHGISGCNIEAVHFRSDQIPGGSYVPVIPTGLNEADCINGGLDKLLAALRITINKGIKANRPPEVVFVLTSDATSIVGDDIEFAARTVEEETGVKIIALDTPGFAGGPVHGTDAALTGLIKNTEINTQLLSKDFKNELKGEALSVSPLPPSRKGTGGECQEHVFNANKPDKHKINLIAPYLIGSKNWTNDTDEMIRLLKASGIEINLNLCRNLEIKDISRFSEAKYNYILSSEEMPNFENLCRELNTEILEENLPLPVGVANTEEWLLKLAEKFGDTEKAKKILKEDQKFVGKQLRFNYNFSWMSTLMHGKKCGLLGQAKFTASLARCLFYDFGIQPKVIGLFAETKRAEQESLELLEEMKNQAEFTILINPSYFEYGNYLKNAEVDFAIGSVQDKPLCLGHKIPHLSLTGFNFFNQYNFIPYPNFGIRGTLGILSELSKIMEDAFYLKDSISANNYQSLEF